MAVGSGLAHGNGPRLRLSRDRPYWVLAFQEGAVREEW